MRMTLGSNGVETAFDHPRPSFCKIDSIYLLEEIAIESGVIVISIPMILVGSPRSVTSHLLLMSNFILSISMIVIANSNRSSTHTVIIVRSLPIRMIYTQGSECRHT